eukprot:TRINITY_DN13556_c0_g1_i1.p1 TRINITY_DN13556_c0_g1~~TRINITY_DN13556_c0_g1_i1.p1  ORF type:complete len:851 (+),score=240.06 TRINITY_DN13556_c0_g1_i1:57-2555(+)
MAAVPAAATSSLAAGFRLVGCSLRPGEDGRAGERVYLLRHSTGVSCLLTPDARGRDAGVALSVRTPLGGGALAHCVEHSVLRGSRRYPSEDAWGQMASRCMLSAAEAVTTPHCTTFSLLSPSSGEVARAIPVLADLVFRPLLRNESVHAEAVGPHRGHLRGGVVFNEQLGAVAAVPNAHSVWVQRGLLAGALGRPVGGTAGAVSKVTPAAVRRFHREHYVPSNTLAVVRARTPADARTMLEALGRALQVSGKEGGGPTPAVRDGGRRRRQPRVASVVLPGSAGDAAASLTWMLAMKNTAAAAEGTRAAATALAARLTAEGMLAQQSTVAHGADLDFSSPLLTLVAGPGAPRRVADKLAAAAQREAAKVAAADLSAAVGTALREAAQRRRRTDAVLASCARTWAEGGDPLTAVDPISEAECASAAGAVLRCVASSKPDLTLLFQRAAGGKRTLQRWAAGFAARCLRRAPGAPCAPRPTAPAPLPEADPSAAAQAVAAACTRLPDECVTRKLGAGTSAAHAAALQLLGAATARRCGGDAGWVCSAGDDGGCALALSAPQPAEEVGRVIRAVPACSDAELSAAAQEVVARCRFAAAQSPHWAAAARAAVRLAATGRAPLQRVVAECQYAAPETLVAAAQGDAAALRDLRRLLRQVVGGTAPAGPAASGTTTEPGPVRGVGSSGVAIPHTVRSADVKRRAALLVACQLLTSKVHNRMRAARASYSAAAYPVADAVWMWAARDPDPTSAAGALLREARALAEERPSDEFLKLLKVTALRHLLVSEDVVAGAAAAAATPARERVSLAKEVAATTAEEVAAVWRECVLPHMRLAATATA